MRILYLGTLQTCMMPNQALFTIQPSQYDTGSDSTLYSSDEESSSSTAARRPVSSWLTAGGIVTLLVGAVWLITQYFFKPDPAIVVYACNSTANPTRSSLYVPPPVLIENAMDAEFMHKKWAILADRARSAEQEPDCTLSLVERILAAPLLYLWVTSLPVQYGWPGPAHVQEEFHLSTEKVHRAMQVIEQLRAAGADIAYQLPHEAGPVFDGRTPTALAQKCHIGAFLHAIQKLRANSTTQQAYAAAFPTWRVMAYPVSQDRLCGTWQPAGSLYATSDANKKRALLLIFAKSQCTHSAMSRDELDRMVMTLIEHGADRNWLQGAAGRIAIRNGNHRLAKVLQQYRVG